MKRLMQFFLLFNLFGHVSAQDSAVYFVGIYKSTSIEDAKSVSTRLVEKSKLIKWYQENLWIVAIGPTTIEDAKKIELDIAAKTNTKGQTQIIKFSNNYLKLDSEVLNASMQLTADVEINSNSTNVQRDGFLPKKNEIETNNNLDWIEVKQGVVRSNPNINFNIYLRLESEYSNLKHLSHLINWSEKLDDGTRSRLNKIIVNCQTGKYGFVESNYYSDLFARGSVIKKSADIFIQDITTSENAGYYREACGKSIGKDNLKVKNEWEKLFLEINKKDLAVADEIKNIQQQNEQVKVQNNVTDASCKPAINEKFNSFSQNKNGVYSGRKVASISRIVTYDEKMTNNFGFGSNRLSIYAVKMDNIKDGFLSGVNNLKVNCVLNRKNQVLSVEPDFR